jgi:hypothetical protein
MDDTDEDESETEDAPRDDLSDDHPEEDRILEFLKNKRSGVSRKNSKKELEAEEAGNDDDDFDHGSFIENMLNTFSDQ